MDAGTIGAVGGILVALALLTERLTEEVLGAWLKGRWVKLGALGSGVALIYAAYALAPALDVLAPVGTLDPAWLWAPGLLVGLGSNVVHAFFGAFLPKLNAHQIVGLPKSSPAKRPDFG